MAALAHPVLLLRTWAAFACDCARYRVGVAPAVRAALAHWRDHARDIPDPALRALALSKLAQEGFHAEAGAMLATRVPHARRDTAVQAIVALEVLYDYLDGRSEPEPPEESRRLFAAFTAAVAAPSPNGDGPIGAGEPADGEYLGLLGAAVRDSLAQLPAAEAVRLALQESAARGSEAQVRVHAGAEVEAWARANADGGALQWREYLAGAAASVLACHALIAAAGRDGTTREEADALAAAYLPVCALTTLLDGVVDHEGQPGDATTDGREGEDGYIGFYANHAALSAALAGLAESALAQAPGLRRSGHHLAMLAGILAYYGTAPGARSGFARSVLADLRSRFGLLVLPMIALMHAWRAARRSRGE